MCLAGSDEPFVALCFAHLVVAFLLVSPTYIFLQLHSPLYMKLWTWVFLSLRGKRALILCHPRKRELNLIASERIQFLDVFENAGFVFRTKWNLFLPSWRPSGTGNSSFLVSNCFIIARMNLNRKPGHMNFSFINSSSCLKSDPILKALNKSSLVMFLLYSFGIIDDQCVGNFVSFRTTLKVNVPLIFLRI